MNLEKFEIRHDGRSTSPEMLDILQRMDSGETVSEEEIESTPEIIEARQQFSEIIEEIGTDSTSTIDTEQRESMRMEIREKLQEAGSVVKDENGKTSMTGEVREESRLDIVIGLPAAGKSSVIVDSLSQEHGSKVIDSDDAKKLIPEFRDGIGANIVHVESADINNNVLQKARDIGQNIILPIIGSNPDSVKKTIDTMKGHGYKVYVHYVEVRPETARMRMLGRFITDGRFVDYKNLERYTNEDGSSKCDRSFEVLKEDPNVDGYTHWDNDVEEGEPARLVEAHNVDIPDAEPKDAAVKDDMETGTEATSSEDYRADEVTSDKTSDMDGYTHQDGNVEENEQAESVDERDTDTQNADMETEDVVAEDDMETDAEDVSVPEGYDESKISFNEDADIETGDALAEDDMETDTKDVSTPEGYDESEISFDEDADIETEDAVEEDDADYDESAISFDEDTDADIDVEASFAMGSILDGLETDISDYLKADDTDGFGAVDAEENEDDADKFGEVDTEEDEDNEDWTDKDEADEDWTDKDWGDDDWDDDDPID